MIQNPSFFPFVRRNRSLIPGYRLTLGVSLFYLSLLVFLPFAALVTFTLSYSPTELWKTALDPRTLAAIRLTLTTSLVAAAINVLFGGLLAWVLCRYDFPGRKVIDTIVDLPFALPTAVAGITLTALYSPQGFIGRLLVPLKVQLPYTPAGIIIALVFIGIPFVVRSLEPVLENLDPELEEAALSLGANRFDLIWRIIIPEIAPALLSGFIMALARGIGEYGSVIFIAGNIPYFTEVASLLIMIRIEEYNFGDATTLALIMLLLSFSLLYLFYLVGNWATRRWGYEL